MIKVLSCGVVVLGLWACKQPTSQGQPTFDITSINATVVTPINAVTTTPQTNTALVEATLIYLKEKHNIDSTGFGLKSIESVNWANSCLGINYPDKLCAQVITPGFKLIFENRQRQLIVHTDVTGRRIVLANP